MRERVLYLLGAGFSAPLGLPVMSNFLAKSKDMYFNNTNAYSSFKKILDKIKELSVVKNYYSTDLFNIEEIVSILEMQAYLENQRESSKRKDSDNKESQHENFLKLFKRYIADVIKHYTTDIETNNNKLPSIDNIFAKDEDNMWNLYGFFVSNLLNIKMTSEKSIDGSTYLYCEEGENPKCEYGVITLNYDLILEKVIDHLKEKYDPRRIVPSCDSNSNSSRDIFKYAKIHGTIEPDASSNDYYANIILPTWNKNNENFVSTWKLAYELLSNANYIRIVGYSLPISDSYIKYLLKSAILDSDNLKKIDVICLDPSGEIKQRYDKLIDFTSYTFKNGNIKDYMNKNLQSHTIEEHEAEETKTRKKSAKSTKSGNDTLIEILHFNKLEDIHSEFMKEG